MPTVTVVIPNYNHAPYLRKRLESILEQTYQDFEVLFLDDASTDNSLQVVEQFRADRRIRVLKNQAHVGSPTKLWNAGVRAARGDFVWIAESNDFCAVNFLETLLIQLDKHPMAGIALCQSREVDENGFTHGVCEFESDQPEPELWKRNFVMKGKTVCATCLSRKNIIPTASAALFRRATWQRAGLADEALRYGCDWMTWVKMLLVADLVFVAQPLNHFRSAARFRNSNIDNALVVRETYRIIQFLAQWTKMEKRVASQAFNTCAAKWARGIFIGEKRISWTQYENIFRLARGIDPKARSRFLSCFLNEFTRHSLGYLRGNARSVARWFRRVFTPPVVRWKESDERTIRVAVFVDFFPETTFTTTLGLIAALLDRGHQVEIFACRAANHPIHPDIARYNLDALVSRRVEIPRSPLRAAWATARLALRAVSRSPRLCARFLAGFRSRSCADNFAALRDAMALTEFAWFDVIHCESDTQGLRAVALKDLGVLKGNIWSNFATHHLWPKVSKKQNRAYRDLFTEGAGFLIPTHILTNRMVEMGCSARKLRFQPLGVDCDRAKATEGKSAGTDGQIMILTVADLVEQSGLENAIRAFAEVAKSRPAIQYKIVGEGPLRSQLRDLIRNLELGERVALLGEQDSGEIDALIERSSLVLDVLQPDSGANEEAAGQVALRAVAVGVPVVCAPTAFNLEILHQGVSGVMLSHQDIPQLAEKIGTVVDAPDVWSEVSMAAHESLAARFSSRQAGQRIAEIYISQYGQGEESKTKSSI